MSRHLGDAILALCIVVAIIVLAVLAFDIAGFIGSLGIDKHQCLDTGGTWHSFPIGQCAYGSR